MFSELKARWNYLLIDNNMVILLNQVIIIGFWFWQEMMPD